METIISLVRLVWSESWAGSCGLEDRLILARYAVWRRGLNRERINLGRPAENTPVLHSFKTVNLLSPQD